MNQEFDVADALAEMAAPFLASEDPADRRIGEQLRGIIRGRAKAFLAMGRKSREEA